MRSISPAIYDLIQDIRDQEEPEADSGDYTSENHLDQNKTYIMTSASSLLVAKPQVLPPCVVLKTPPTTSIRSPLTPCTVTTRRRSRQVANIESSAMPLL